MYFPSLDPIRELTLTVSSQQRQVRLPVHEQCLGPPLRNYLTPHLPVLYVERAVQLLMTLLCSSSVDYLIVPVTMPAAEDRPLGEILPKEEIIDGCKTFMNCCFQLHFLSKVRFLAHVERDPGSINQFLLTCILGLSARFTPSLIKRFGGAEMAADVFIQRAEQLALAEIYKPTLETVQGLILLGASEWAKGECNKGLVSFVVFGKSTDFQMPC